VRIVELRRKTVTEEAKATVQATPPPGAAAAKTETTSAAAAGDATQSNTAATSAGAAETIATAGKVVADTKAVEAQVVPDKYDLKLPKDSPLSKESVERIALISKERKLSQEQAQALLETESNAVTSFTSLQQDEFKKQVGAWAEQAKSDKEIGGDGFVQNAELAKRVVDKFGSAELKKQLDDTGLGNHPELLRFCVRLGKSMKEDSLVLGGAKGEGKKSAAELFYGTQK
jgi:hypothetical protein